MDFVFHETALRRLLNEPTGPVGQHIARKGQRVGQRARINASDRPGPRIRTGDLVQETSTRPLEFVDGELQSAIGSTARHGGVAYPTLQERGGTTPTGAYYRYPWLEPALATEFGASFRG